MASSVPAAKAALLALMDGDSTLSQVAHGWGPPPPDQFQQEHIWLGDTTGIHRVPAGIGKGKFEESYTLTVTVHVRKGAYDEQATETRAWAIVAALEALLVPTPANQTNVTLSGAVRTAIIGDGMNSKGYPVQDNAGWASEIDVPIAVEARI